MAKGQPERGTFPVENAASGLRERDVPYRTLFDTIDDGLCVVECICDENGRVVDWVWREANAAFEEQSGLSGAVGKSASKVLPNLGRAWPGILTRVLETGVVLRTEDDYSVDLDRWWRCHYARLGGSGSRLVSVRFEDITERKRAEAALKKNEERQIFLLRLSDAIRRRTDPASVQTIAMRMLGEHLKVGRAFYFVVERTGDHWVHSVVDDWTYSTEMPSMAGRWPPPGHRRISKDLEHGAPLVISDVGELKITPEEYQDYIDIGVMAAVVYPIMKEGRYIGGVCVHSPVAREWMEDEISLIEDVAERTWSAVERARVAAALKANEEKYRTIFSTIDEGFALMELRTDEEGNVEDVCFREVNESFERQTGLEGVTGKTARGLFPDLEQAWLDIYAQVARTGEPRRVEGYVKDLKGWYNAHFSLVGAHGSKSVAVVFRNVTERHKAEELQREREEEQAFLLRFGDLIRPLADLKAIAVTTTRVAAEYFKADRCWIARISPEEGKAWLEHETRRPDLFSIEGEYNLAEYPEVMKNAKTETLVFGDVQGSAALSAQDKRGLATMRVGAFLAAIPQKGDREYFWDLVIAADGPRDWSSGDATILNGIAERTWAALVRSKEEAALRETEKLAVVGRLASSIAHEINNPLEAITNLLYLIEQSRLPGEAAEYLRQAQAELRRISEITMQMLRFGRRNSTQMAVELSDVVESVVKLHDGKLKMARVQMERRYRSDSMLVCFPNELRQVIANLVENAIDSMNGFENPRLYLRAQDAHDPVSGVAGIRLTIADTGAGMGRSTLRHIWEPFFSTKGATGTGLGLWVTREIVRKHQGSVSVRSCTRSHRHGSVFSVFLPHVGVGPNAAAADEGMRAIA